VNELETSSREYEIKRIGVALHDLCQPLTTLQCRLELAGMVGTPEAYREAVQVGLTECERLTQVVSSIREMLRGSREGSGRGQDRVAR
jgi:signal transduction histidine kinase